MRYQREGDLYIIRFEDGDVFPDQLLSFLEAQSIRGGSLTGLGAFSRSVIAFFDTAAREYQDIELDEQLEVLALVGNVAVYEDAPLVHAHVMLGRRDGTALGGHLRRATVRPTLEVFLHVIRGPLRRAVDRVYGLPALDLGNEHT
ncbi:MAG: DUF296 domain-containing protein [Gemmatimonadales bacterium]|nr:DUF296 domain-containing protein [Gemmatimonadales bacterium]NIS64138.1 DUF296 domain-containing protein [Gemmatimonadales bacterium]